MRLDASRRARMYSSLSTTMSPLRPLTVTGTISSLNLPAFCAASALFCEATANSSCSSRVICHLRGDVLGGLAHVVAVEGVPQAVLDHGVDELRGRPSSCRCAGARACGAMRHDSWPPATTIVGVAVGDLLHAERDGAQAGAAELVQAPGRSPPAGCRRPSRPGGPGSGPAPAVQDLAEDHLVDLAPARRRRAPAPP